MSKAHKEKTAPILNMGVTVGGQDSLVGEIISINLRRDPFFMIGDISLSKVKTTPVYKPDGVLEGWYTLVKKEGRSKLSVESFRQLIKMGMDNNYSLAEIVLYCLRQEEDGARREPVIGLLKEVLKYSDGRHEEPEVYEEEEGKIAFRQTKDGVIIHREGTYPVPPPPPGHKAGSKSSSEALGDIMEF
jgi:hypothetical protein